MRVLPLIGLLAGCTSQNVVPLADFGPIRAYVDVELGPLGVTTGAIIDPPVLVSFSHTSADCPVFDGDVKASIDGVRPDRFERGYYKEPGALGHDAGSGCQTPYFTINKVPAAKELSTLRLSDATAALSLTADRLFVNPTMTLASPLLRGEQAVIDVADDRPIKRVEATWRTEGATKLYDLMPTVSSQVISVWMPSDTSGPGSLYVHVELESIEPTCVGFSGCTVNVKGSEKFDATLE